MMLVLLVVVVVVVVVGCGGGGGGGFGFCLCGVFVGRCSLTFGVFLLCSLFAASMTIAKRQ